VPKNKLVTNNLFNEKAGSKQKILRYKHELYLSLSLVCLSEYLTSLYIHYYIFFNLKQYSLLNNIVC